MGKTTISEPETIRNDILISNPLHGESKSISKPSSDRNFLKSAFKKSADCDQKDTIAFSPNSGKSRYSLQGAYAWYNKLDGSMMTIGAIVFVGDTSRGVLFPVLSTLNATLRGTVVDLGYLVAIFSVGRLVITAPLGYMSDKYRHKMPLLLASSLLILGAILWANAYYTNKLAVLYVAQFLLGVGSGSLGVTRSFVVEQCEPKKRTEALALITALQYAGFTVSPIIGSWLLTIGSNSSPYWSFALPPYFIALLALWCIIALLCVFQNIPAAPVEFTHSAKELTPMLELTHVREEGPPSPSESSAEYKSNLVEEGKSSDVRKASRSRASSVRLSSKSEPQKLIDAQKLKRGMFYVIIGMFLLNIATKGSISVYETLGAQIGLVDYNMSTVALGALVSGAGAVGFCQLLLFTSLWTKYFSDVKLMLGGIGVMIIAQMFGLSYGSIPDFWRYVVSVVLMYAIGYPIGHTAVLGAFSKIQKSGPQAAMMGWFATSGSLSRIILPIISGYLDKAVDNSPFNIVLFMLTLAYLGIVLLKPQMRIYIEVVDVNAPKISSEEDEDGETHTGIRGFIHSTIKLWESFSLTEKAEVVVTVFLLFFSIFDLIALSGGLRKRHGFNTYEDHGYDID